jgi:phosphatidylinositol 4-kinase A
MLGHPREGNLTYSSHSQLDNDILHYLVWLPFRAFSPRAVAAGTDAWTWLVSERPSAEMALLAEVVAGWTWTIHSRKGLFNTVLK